VGWELHPAKGAWHGPLASDQLIWLIYFTWLLGLLLGFFPVKGWDKLSLVKGRYYKLLRKKLYDKR